MNHNDKKSKKNTFQRIYKYKSSEAQCILFGGMYENKRSSQLSEFPDMERKKLRSKCHLIYVYD
jgi:hypothetical protein